MFGIFTRIILSLFSIGAYEAFANVWYAGIGEASGAASIAQMGDTAYTPIAANVSAYTTFAPLPFLILLLALIVIWFSPAKRYFMGVGATLALAGMLVIGTPSPKSFAYYNTRDFPEFVEIQPNWSAILLAEVGDTKTNQAAFMSEAYLNANKVAGKRIKIEHVLIHNPGWNADYFVPAARLMIVDRAPVSRVWSSSSTTGTSKENQGFRFESSESIGMSTAVVISAFVKEQDTAKFFYWFGAKSIAQNVSDPEINFASVTFGKSLSDVADDNIHRAVQAILAREWGKLTTLEGLKHKAEIMNTVAKETTEQFAAMGVTITTLGYGDEISFDDPEIQKSINKTFIAVKDAEAATSLAVTLPTQQIILDMDIKRMDAMSRAKLADRWDGKATGILPSWVIMPGDIMSTVKGWFVPTPEVAPVSAKHTS